MRTNQLQVTDQDRELLWALTESAVVATENACQRDTGHERYRHLRRSQAQLLQAEKLMMLGRLAASVTLEIGSPLQAMQTCLELMQEELEGPGRRHILARRLSLALRETERMGAHVRRLRDFYMACEQRQPANLNDIIENVLQLTSQELQHSQVIIQYALERDLPPIHANRGHLSQVFLNLVINAIDAMPNGGILSVRTARDTMPGKSSDSVAAVRVDLADTGIGMKPDMLAHLFEPFVTDKSTGTPLGLAISYEIIQAHGGEIVVTSQEGKGSTFTIWLPASVD